MLVKFWRPIGKREVFHHESAIVRGYEFLLNKKKRARELKAG
jgi:hypothetical protein